MRFLEENPRHIIYICLAIVCVGTIVDSLELSYIRDRLPFDVHKRSKPGALSRSLPGVLSLVLLARTCVALSILRGVSVSSVEPLLVLALLFLSLFVCLLAPLIQGGDTQLTNITLLASSVALLVGSDYAAELCMVFLTFQVSCAYFAAGLHKLSAIQWRNGSALITVAGGVVFGNPTLHRLLRSHPRLAFISSWLIIVWEMAFFSVVLLPPTFVACVLLVGMCFHVVNALAMGLNKFVWAFVGVYPAVWYTAIRVH